MTHYRYILEPYKGTNSRYICPDCQNPRKTFVRYLDTQTGEHIADNIGRCNRQINCGYHYTPKQYFEDNRGIIGNHWQKFNIAITPTQKPVSLIDIKLFNSSLKSYDNNHFVNFLTSLFGISITNQLIETYFIGTSKHWQGATVFWQIDIKGKIRTGKIMLYNPNTGKRIKEPFNHINWVHSVLKLPDFNLKQCLFGEHLLQNNTKPVAIVESEKTAIIASVYLPEFIWLASGSLSNLSPDKCQILKGGKIVLFPDLKGYDNWNNKAKELSQLAKFSVSDLLEHKAPETDKEKGFDLADYLVQKDKNFGWALTDNEYPLFWDL